MQNPKPNHKATIEDRVQNFLEINRVCSSRSGETRKPSKAERAVAVVMSVVMSAIIVLAMSVIVLHLVFHKSSDPATFEAARTTVQGVQK